MTRQRIRRSVLKGHGTCEHHAVVRSSLPKTGRCLECGALVPTPFPLH